MENTSIDHVSDNGEGEDIPSDFFDDFNKDEFMEGLSVIDSWDDETRAKKRSRIDAEKLESVKDLRELIGDGNEDHRSNRDDTEGDYKDRKGDYSPRERRSSSRIDEFIKPGSRRDPKKTNEAIKKDKEVKVKEYLAKHLESTDSILPPGTELDDYYDQKKSSVPKELDKMDLEPLENYHSPKWSPKWSPKCSPERSYGHSPKQYSPQHSFHTYSHSSKFKRQISPRYESSYHKSPFRRQSRLYRRPFRNFSPPRKMFARRSPYRQSPPRRSPPRRSPPRRSPSRRSPLRRSHRSPYRQESRSSRRSPSPYQRSKQMKRSRSKSPDNNFLYPKDSIPLYPSAAYSLGPGQHAVPTEPIPMMQEYTGGIPDYSYPQGSSYSGFSAPYDYGVQTVAPSVVIAPQPVPAPHMGPVLNSAPLNVNPIPPPLNPMATQILPEPPHQQMIPLNNSFNHMNKKTPNDALAQLVAEGKISKEDYLKLAPNKGPSSSMDTQTRVVVLNRCNDAILKLGKLLLPNRLILNNSLLGVEPKSIVPKYCSPLKRQSNVQFHFTKADDTAVSQYNKRLIDSLLTTLGLDKVVSRPKKKSKNMKDAAVQTTKPYCDICDIRESTKFYDASTSIDHEHFSSAVHTQVLEQDLLNSKSIFNPSGSVAGGGPISIAHLTPAQLVSQLAARAKTLKQTPDPGPSQQFRQRYPPNNYDGRSGGQQYRNDYY